VEPPQRARITGGEFAATLEAARRPVERCPMPPADLRTRLSTSPALRRLLPTQLAVARAERRGAQLWERYPQERARARAAMDAVAGGTIHAGDVEHLARELLVEERAKETLFWQPWRPQLEPSSSERLRAALSRDRGVLLSSCHSGPYLLALTAVAQLGCIPYSAAGPWSFEPPEPGPWGRRIARRRNQARARGERLIYSVGSFATLSALLLRGETVSVFFSMPGSRETLFLGKPVMLASGSARLAVEADALVLPIRTRRERHRVLVDVGAALDPRDHADVGELHDALAAAHERWILERPAAMEDPNREGAWEQSATAAGWVRPERQPVAS
jgi:lauroyl/myristoyl acyltransferase